MNFTFGLLAGESKLIIREFTPEGITDKTTQSSEIEQADIDLLFYDRENLTNETAEILEKGKKFYPVSHIYDEACFQSLNHEEALQTMLKTNESWVLRNNLSLISDIFNVRDYLVELLHRDRTSFFEELWFLVRSNLGCRGLTIIFNDVEKGKKQHEKDKLVKAKVTGTNLPDPVPTEEIDQELMDNYKNEFTQSFNISELNESRGELVATAKVNGGPVLIMAKIKQLSALQKAVMTALFNGLKE